MAPYIYALIVISIGIVGLAEILVERQKKQMKRQFLDELEQKTSSSDEKSAKDPNGLQ